MNRSKNFLIRTVLVLLALLLLSVGLTACKKNEEPPADSTAEGNTEPSVPPVNFIDFFGGTPEEFVVIYPAKAGNSVKNAARSVTASLNDAYGLELQCRADDKVKAEESPKEILVGDTNRAESAAALARNGEKDDFVLQRVGTRLVLVGGNYDGTARAADYLIDYYILGNSYTSLMIEEDLDLEWKYREQCAALFLLASDYTVVYGDRSEAGVKQLAKDLAEELGEITDISMESKSDLVTGVSIFATDYQSDAPEVLVGATNRLESNAGDELAYMDYEIRYTDNKIVLRGGSMEALRRAVLDFRDTVTDGRLVSLTDPAESTVSRLEDIYTQGDVSVRFAAFTPAWADEYTPKDWQTDLDEKIVALNAMNARNMSASLGGDIVRYASHSPSALFSAVKAGVDLLEVNVQETRDGVLVVFPTEELSVVTDADDKKGVGGKPMQTLVSEWTYEELSELRFLDQEGTLVTEDRVLTLYEVVALCKDRCLLSVNLPESDYDVNAVMFDILEEHQAFLSYFVSDPLNQTVSQPLTMDALTEWKSDSENAMQALATWKNQLFDANGEQRLNRYTRKVFTDNVLPESPSRWQALREEWKTFLYTKDVVSYCSYISETYPSALVSTETVVGNTVYTISDPAQIDGRVMVFSDPHYYPKNNRLGEDKTETTGSVKTDPNANQLAQMQARLEIIIDMIVKEYNGRGLDAIAILGDLSTDNWNDEVSSTHTEYYKEFYEELRAGLVAKGIPASFPIYALAGNHDSVSNEAWKNVFGTDRQHAFTVGDKLFLMLDTFYAYGVGSTGAEYKGLTEADYAWIDEQIKANPGKKVVVCAHSFNSEYKNLAEKYANIEFFFQGHSHQYRVNALNADTYFIDEGGFSYTAFSAYTGPAWDFGYLDLRSAWGYQIVEWNEDRTVTYHVSIAHEYFATNMYYIIPEDLKTTDVVLTYNTAA